MRWSRRVPAVGLSALVVACAGTAPSRAPLAPPVPHSDPVVRPSSSRAVEGNEASEESDSVEIVIQPSDDDDDSVTRSVAPDCAKLSAPSSCLGASIARRACETLGPAVDPRAFAAWFTCMQDPGSGSACDTHRIVACGLRAVNGTGVDGSYTAFCTHIASECSDMAEEITAPVCEHLIAAWKPDHRNQMIDCLRQGCETGGFGACLP